MTGFVCAQSWTGDPIRTVVGAFTALLIYCSGQRAMKIEQVKEIKTGYFQRGIRESINSKRYALSCFQKIAIFPNKK